MDDLISRQEAINALGSRLDKAAKGEIGSFYNTIIQRDIECIERLPSAQPERKDKENMSGKWLKNKDYNYADEECGFHLTCSNCGFVDEFCENYHFCPNCGAKMEVEHEADH